MVSVPLTKIAPSGMPLIWIESVSEPSVSVRAELIFSAIAVSSSPEAAEASSVGISATAATSTVDVVVAMAPLSPVAETVISNEPLQSSAGVNVKLSSCSDVKVQVPSPLSVPADSVPPSGTLVIVTETAFSTAISREMVVSSLPVALTEVTLGSGVVSTPSTDTLCVTLAESWFDCSVEVAVTLNEKASVPAGTIMVSSDS